LIRRLGACLAAALVAANGAASAAQVSTTNSPNIPQVSGTDNSVSVEPVAQARGGGATTQLSNQSDSMAAEAQLTTVKSSSGQPTQLTHGPKSAQPPQALSRVAEGRTGAIERVEGSDRCDPKLPKEKNPTDCSRVIESRADDYDRPAPTQLSPEQRLLLDQQLQTAGDDVADATRRLASSGHSDNSIESLGIASIVLGQDQPPQKPVKEEDPATDAATQAVLQILSSLPPTQN